MMFMTPGRTLDAFGSRRLPGELGGKQRCDEVQGCAALGGPDVWPVVQQVGGERMNVPPSIALVQSTQEHSLFIDSEVGARSTRGIAVQLGAAGATVYVTGRTSGSAQSEMNGPETIEETAALVDEAGGRGIAVQVDHLVPDEVGALVARIEAEQGALHVLVNDIWGATTMEWDKSVWESSLEIGRGPCAWACTRTPSPATSRCRCSSRRQVAWLSR